MVSWRRSHGATPEQPERPDEPAAGNADEGTPREPTPARGEDVPHHVLDELRMAFTEAPPAPDTASTVPIEFTDGLSFPDATDDVLLDATDTTFGTSFGTSFGLDLDDLPPAEYDDFTGEPPRPVTSVSTTPGGPDGPHGPHGPDELPPAEPWVLDPPAAFADDPPPAPPAPFTPFGEAGTGDVRIIRRSEATRPTPAAPVTPIAPAAERDPSTAGPRATIVIGGDDDDLPDPIYLDDDEAAARARSDEGDGGGQTFVLGDELEASGAFDAVQLPSRSMDPRVRARRIAVKRAQSRKRLIWVGAIIGAVVVVVAVLAVFASGLFAVDRVDVQGAPYTQARYADRLQAVIDEMMGEPVLLVDTRAAEEQLEALPWVERAFVRTDFPDRVLIDVRERQPLATFAGSDGRYRVIDRDGYVLDVLDGRPASYMLITGTGPDLEPGSSAGAPYAAAAQLVGALPEELRDITVAAGVDPTTADLSLTIQRIPTAEEIAAGTTETQEVAVRIGSFTGLDAKLARLLQLVRDGLDDAAPIDVSTDDVIG